MGPSVGALWDTPVRGVTVGDRGGSDDGRRGGGGKFVGGGVRGVSSGRSCDGGGSILKG